eukprot:892696-Pelagomonas_calceolata.AAC.3
MATRCQFENSNDVGVFAKLTNAYAIVALGGAENFYSGVACPVCLHSVSGCLQPLFQKGTCPFAPDA